MGSSPTVSSALGLWPHPGESSQRTFGQGGNLGARLPSGLVLASDQRFPEAGGTLPLPCPLCGRERGP